MGIPIDIFLTLLKKVGKGENVCHTHKLYLAGHTAPTVFLYLLYPSIFSLHMYMSCHLHVIKGYLFINVITTYISPYIKQISYSGMQSDHKFNPTAKTSTLLLPHPSKCWHTPDGSSSLPSFSFSPHLRDACQPTLVFFRVFLFVSFYSVSLFAILWFSQKNRESLQGQAILSCRQRGWQTVELNCRWNTPELLVDWPVEELNTG